ncbi:MAG: tRNA dihydrouridine synthase DusB, partial [Deltaproteobacteria bacterium]|nr:tRNA dihydrouridine synthase DusB [Deltaproteobacteria bacterium]
MLSIGNLTIPIPCILAPMSGISDLPFRMINRSFGAPFAFAEMVDVKALSVLDRRTRHMLSSNPGDRPLGVQLLASDSKDIVKALKALDSIEYDLLDFNAACPTPKVVKKGKGASLLKEPHKLKEILEVLVKH